MVELSSLNIRLNEKYVPEQKWVETVGVGIHMSCLICVVWNRDSCEAIHRMNRALCVKYKARISCKDILRNKLNLLVSV